MANENKPRKSPPGKIWRDLDDLHAGCHLQIQQSAGVSQLLRNKELVEKLSESEFQEVVKLSSTLASDLTSLNNRLGDIRRTYEDRMDYSKRKVNSTDMNIALTAFGEYNAWQAEYVNTIPAVAGILGNYEKMTK